MKYKIPTKKVGAFFLPVLGLGTWQMGGRYEADFTRDSEEINFVRQAFAAGLRHFDTAEIYAVGHSEELLGLALKHLPRQDVIVTSKVSGEHLNYNDVLKACRESLARLQTNYLDLYLIHAPSSSGVPLAETMKAMSRLYEEGLIRNIGVSNFDVNLLKEAVACAKYPIVNNQIHFSVGARGYEEDGTLAYCVQQAILVTAYRPVALGTPERTRGSLGKVGWQILSKIAGKYHRTAVQIALAWVLNQENTVTLVRTSNSEHLKENLGAVGFEFEPEDLKFLNEHFPKIPTMRPATSEKS